MQERDGKLGKKGLDTLGGEVVWPKGEVGGVRKGGSERGEERLGVVSVKGRGGIIKNLRKKTNGGSSGGKIGE